MRQHTIAYRKDLIALMRELLAMEELVLNGDHGGAMAKVIDPVYPMRLAAHKKYQVASEER